MANANLLIGRLAKRNIFRNSRRTILTVVLIGFGLSALLFTDAFMHGTYESMIKISTETFLGEAQIHQQGFRKTNDIDIYIANTESLYKKLDTITQIHAYSPRTITGGMISSSENVSSGIIYGINGTQEAQVSKLQAAMIKGQYLTGQIGEILIGYDMADLLKVELGDRIVLTASQVHGGELSQELFRVSGLFRFNDREMDKGLAFINLPQAQSILGMNGVHEIALRFQNLSQADDTKLKLWSMLNNKNLETLSWRDLIPQLSAMLDISDYSTWIIATVLFVLVALGLINSMFMSIYERQNEFGILLAIGTRPQQLFWQIIMEGFCIGILGVIFGLLCGIGISYFFSLHGIDYSGTEMLGVTINDPIYTHIYPLEFIKLSLAILVITVLACIYPAAHAAHLEPSNAMRKIL